MISIDVSGNKIIRLKQGDFSKVTEYGDVNEVLELLSTITPANERVHVVDIDGVNIGSPQILPLIEKMNKMGIRTQVGGGIRTEHDIKRYIDVGSYVVVSSILKDIPHYNKMKDIFGTKLILALDVDSNDYVCVDGWKTKLFKITDIPEHISKYGDVLITKIENDGMLSGVDIAWYDNISNILDIPKWSIIISGGVDSFDTINTINKMGYKYVVGRFIHDMGIDEFYVNSMKYDKYTDGLIPTIIQDVCGVVLSLTFSNKESILKTLHSGKYHRYSREYQMVMMKGAVSKNIQKVKRVFYDCDRDSLLVVVDQVLSACHIDGNYSCFGLDKKYALGPFENMMHKIQYSIKTKNPESYSNYIINHNKLNKKIIEEAAEVALASTTDEVILEIADLLYMLGVKMATHNIEIHDVTKLL